MQPIDPTPFNIPPYAAFFAYVVAGVLVFCGAIITAVLASESNRGKRHAESERARDKMHITAINRHTEALNTVRGLQVATQVKLEDHIDADEKAHELSLEATCKILDGQTETKISLDRIDNRLKRLEKKGDNEHDV